MFSKQAIRTIKDIDEAGYDLRVWCYACQRAAVINGIIWMEFVEKGWPIEISEARKRFTCKQCRSSRDVLLIAASPVYARDWKGMTEAFFFANRKKRR